MDKLAILASRCKSGVYVEINAHRDLYENAGDRLENHYRHLQGGPEISPELAEQMIKKDQIIAIQFYEHTPVGFCRVLHHDLDAALDEALQGLKHPRVMAAAIMTTDGPVHLPPPARHHNVMKYLIDGLGCSVPAVFEEGFMLEDGTYTGPVFARICAEANGQLLKQKAEYVAQPGDCEREELSTVDLW